MSQAHQTLLAMLEADRKRDSDAYNADDARRQLMNQIVAEIEDAWTVFIDKIFSNRIKIDLTFFTREILEVEGARYLSIAFGDTDGDAPPAHPVRLLEVRRRDDGKLAMFDVQRRHWAGHIYEGTFHHVWLADRDDGGCNLHCTFWNERLLPVTGPVVDKHPTAARAAALAARLVADPRFAEIEALGARAHALRKGFTPAMNEAVAFAQSRLGERREALEVANPTLVRDLSTHDWTWEYADRFIRSAADQEDRIKAALRKLDIDDAACLFVVHARASWRYMRSYLDKHPAVRVAAAA
jgi:hypothetical protein